MTLHPSHPRYGSYGEPPTESADVVDLVRIASHPASRGRFVLEGLGPGSVFVVRSTTTPLTFTTAERPDAEFLVDALNALMEQLGTIEPPALSAAEQQARDAKLRDIDARLAPVQKAIADIEVAEWGSSRRPPHPQQGVSGPARVAQYDELKTRELLLTRERAALVEA